MCRACVLCVVPMGCSYGIYLVWGAVVLASTANEEAVIEDQCGVGEIWWITFTAVVVAWTSGCCRICNAQSAHDMVGTPRAHTASYPPD